MKSNLLRTWSLLILASTLSMTSLGGALSASAAPVVHITQDGETVPLDAELVCGITMVTADSLALLDIHTFAAYDGRLLLSKDHHRVEIGAGSLTAVINGHEIRGIPAPTVQGDQVMVPLRFVLESMGYDVEWRGGPDNSVAISAVAQNDLIIATVRERLETKTLSIDVQYPKFTGLEQSVEQQLNAYFAERIEIPKAHAYVAERQNSQEIFYRPTQLFCNYLVQYNRNGMLSLTLDDYLYTGGAHGGTIRSGYTFELESGRLRELKDIFAPDTDYVTLLSTHIAEQIRHQDMLTLIEFTSIRPDQDFYLSGDSLVIYFQQYELMPYAYGFPEFRIKLSSLRSWLHPEFASLQ